jgi:hypothetical protein
MRSPIPTLLITVALMLPTNAMAQRVDKASLIPGEARRCENALLKKPDTLTDILTLGVSLPALCQCSATIFVSYLTELEAETLSKRSQLPQNFRMRFGNAVVYCAHILARLRRPF